MAVLLLLLLLLLVLLLLLSVPLLLLVLLCRCGSEHEQRSVSEVCQAVWNSHSAALRVTQLEQQHQF
jgi:hypothetical protein